MLSLPVEFGRPGAHISRMGRRSLSWSLLEPGELYRNQYVMAWIEVSERTPWRGEPLWLTAHRRRGESYAREGFTDKALQGLHKLFVPQLARCFDELWTTTHRTISRPSTALIEQAEEMRRWAQDQHELQQLHVDGQISFRPYERAYPLMTIWPEHQRRHMTEIVATAWVDGEQVGWMADNGDLIPLSREMSA